MTRVRALFLAALMALAPVMGAVCANACHDVAPPPAAQTTAACEHSEARDTGPSLLAADCAADPAAFVAAGFRNSATDAHTPEAAPRFVWESRSVRSHERLLRLQSPPSLLSLALRI
jgi:hypothetical protein